MTIGQGLIKRLLLMLENLLDVSISNPSNGQVLTYENGLWKNEAGGGGGGSGFTVTAVDNGSPYTAGTGANIYTIYNSSGSAYTFKLNASPNTNDVCVIVDAGLTAGNHTITIQGNGNDIIAYGQSAASSAEIVSNGGSISLAWDTNYWVQYA